MYVFFSCRNGEGQKKTAYKSKTLNPVFNEIFSFQLDQSHIADTKLRVAIWDHDFFGEDDFNGEGVVDLSRIHLSSGTHTDWFILQLEVHCTVQACCKFKEYLVQTSDGFG